jgi:uncharacterized SAM-binding protein YcdF (DUF218 family)
MMFTLKTVVASLVLPFDTILVMLVIGCALLWSKRLLAVGRTLVTAGVIALLLVACGVPFGAVTNAFEHRYAPVLDPASVAGARWVVVLGGGHRARPDIPVSSYPETASLYRIVEGIRLHRLLPGSRIVFSGGGAVGSVSTAKAGSELARVLGVSPEHIVIEEQSESTAEESRRIRDVVRNDPFVLVTSAVHMPRALTFFHARGMNPIPAPTEYLSDGRQIVWPSLQQMTEANAVAHEMVGFGWAWLRGDFGR